jgi:pimeloyl-ACP methyl ester carboxylesterase
LDGKRGMGGIYNSINFALFSYAALNPVAVIDPDGEANFFVGGAMDSASPGSWIYQARGAILSLAGRSSTPSDATFTHSQATMQMDPFSESLDLSHSEAFNAISAMRDANPGEPIDVYGHSWGGAASMQLWNELEEAGISANSVTLFDPVSRSWSRSDKPKNATGSLTNYYIPEGARNEGSLLGGLFSGQCCDGDAVARTGGAWGEVEGANNIPVTNWRGKNQGLSGHMGVFYPLPPEPAKTDGASQ